MITKQPLTDVKAARYVAHTHPLTQQSDETPEDFVLRVVRAYDDVKSIMINRVLCTPLKVRRYKAIRKPRCNLGFGCKRCWDKWHVVNVRGGRESGK